MKGVSPARRRTRFLLFRGPEVMRSTVGAELDFIEELRMRRWAREHYVPQESRESTWHPVVHDEMQCKDLEITEVEVISICA